MNLLSYYLLNLVHVFFDCFFSTESLGLSTGLLQGGRNISFVHTKKLVRLIDPVNGVSYLSNVFGAVNIGPSLKTSNLLLLVYHFDDSSISSFKVFF